MRRARGPFAIQWNTAAHTHEYPAASFRVAELGPSRFLEIGGALSWHHFVLANDGHDVQNLVPLCQ